MGRNQEVFSYAQMYLKSKRLGNDASFMADIVDIDRRADLTDPKVLSVSSQILPFFSQLPSGFPSSPLSYSNSPTSFSSSPSLSMSIDCKLPTHSFLAPTGLFLFFKLAGSSSLALTLHTSTCIPAERSTSIHTF